MIALRTAALPIAVAALATESPSALAACAPAGGLVFVCGIINTEDLARVPGPP